MSILETVRLGGKYKPIPGMNSGANWNQAVTVTSLYRDRAGVEMVKFEPGSFTGNPHGYELLKYFKVKFEQAENEEG